jgi:hypothetical protein
MTPEQKSILNALRANCEHEAHAHAMLAVGSRVPDYHISKQNQFAAIAHALDAVIKEAELNTQLVTTAHEYLDLVEPPINQGHLCNRIRILIDRIK